MTWLLWRQHRSQALVVLLFVVGVAGITIAAGLHIRSTYDSYGLGSCEAGSGNGCEGLSLWLHSDWLPHSFQAFVEMFPVAVGAFLGGPTLAREFEQGTYRLAWSQGVSRRRWVISKLALVAVLGTAACALMAWAVHWYQEPYTHVHSPFDGFDVAPPMFAASFLLTLGMGACAGAFLRRSIASIAVGFVGSLVVGMSFAVWLKSRLLPPLHTVTPKATDWVLSVGYVDRAGHPLTDPMRMKLLASMKPGPHTGANSFQAYVHAHGFLTRSTYQPASRFWTFQFMGASMIAAVGLTLLAFAVFRLRRGIR